MLNDLVKGSNLIKAFGNLAFPSDKFSKDHLIGFFNQMQFCFINYENSGEKKTRAFLDGTLFNFDTEYNADRLKNLEFDLLKFHFFTSIGKIPFEKNII